MNQSKFSLADVLTVLGAVGFGFFCFLSFNFLSLGETIPSIIIATVLALILGGLALGVKLLKKTDRNFKSRIIWEWALLAVFAVFALLFFLFPFSHFFSVSEQRADIQRRVIANVEQAEGMFANFENYANNRLNIHESRLRSVVNARSTNPTQYREFGFVDGTDDNTQIANKMFTLRAQLFPSNFEDMKRVSTAWLADAKNTIEIWKPIGTVSVINDVERNVTDWRNELVRLSSFRAQGEMADNFYFPLTFEDVSDRISEFRPNPTMLSFVIALGLYLLMLFSYFITKRHTRFPGCKVIFGTRSTSINEL